MSEGKNQDQLKRLWTAFYQRNQHLFILLLLAPATGELLGGITMPARFFTPQHLASALIWYGGGALLIRDLVLIWRKRWPAVLLLGAALGILKTGLVDKSWFDQQWPGLGALAGYGWWAGVNWIQALQATIYVMFFGSAIPILLIGIMFPEKENEVWLSAAQRRALLSLLIAAGLWESIRMLFKLPAVLLGCLGLAVAILIILAWRLPVPGGGEPGDAHASRPVRVRAGTFLAAAIFFTLPVVGAKVGSPVALILGLQVLVLVAVVGVLSWGSGPSAGFIRVHQLAMATGGSAYFILQAALRELEKTPIENPQGMGLVAVGAVFLLGWLARRVEKQQVAVGSKISNKDHGNPY